MKLAISQKAPDCLALRQLSSNCCKKKKKGFRQVSPFLHSSRKSIFRKSTERQTTMSEGFGHIKRGRTLKPREIIPSLWHIKRNGRPWNENLLKFVYLPIILELCKYMNIHIKKNYKSREVEEIKEHQALFCPFIKRQIRYKYKQADADLSRCWFQCLKRRST